jgi:uncharacterized membrane protein YjjP (DUF1212 family)
MALPFALWGKPYSAPIARLACAMWAIALLSLTYWIWSTVEEGLARTILTILGGMLAFGAVLEMFQHEPLSRKKD